MAVITEEEESEVQSRRASKMDLLEGTILGKEEAEHHDMMHQLVGWLRDVWYCVCVCVKSWAGLRHRGAMIDYTILPS